MKILVTGGYGFIGSYFIRHILYKYPNYKVVNLDCMTYAADVSRLETVMNNPNYSFVQDSICNIDSYFLNNFDCVVNFAAQSHVDKSFDDSLEFHSTNTYGVLNLLECLKKTNVKKFLQISTDEVYGENLKSIPDDERSFLNPTNPYSASKASADLYCMAYYRTYGLPVMISRSSNNFGSFQNPEKFIPHSIISLLKGEKIKIYGTGLQERDWLFVEDNVRALDLILHYGKLGEIYNISGGNHVKNIDLAYKIIDILGYSPDKIEHIQDRISHDFRYFIDSSKILNELNFKPEANFDFELEKLVKSYL